MPWACGPRRRLPAGFIEPRAGNTEQQDALRDAECFGLNFDAIGLGLGHGRVGYTLPPQNGWELPAEDPTWIHVVSPTP